MQPDYASQKLAAAIIPKRTTVDQHGWFHERRCISGHDDTGTVNINLYEPSNVNFGVLTSENRRKGSDIQ